MTYTGRLSFVIPHFKSVNNEVVGLDYIDFKRYLYTGWQVAGLDSFEVYPIKQVIRGMEYDADKVMVYCADDFEQVVVDIFHQACCKYQSELNMDYYSYERNGVLISLKIGS